MLKAHFLVDRWEKEMVFLWQEGLTRKPFDIPLPPRLYGPFDPRPDNACSKKSLLGWHAELENRAGANRSKTPYAFWFASKYLA